MKYDTLIVGGGTAGAILAARLSEDSSRAVLLIEAGPDYASPGDLPDDIRYDPITASWRAANRAGVPILSSSNELQGERADHVVPKQGGHMRYYAARSTPLSPKMTVSSAKVMGGGSAINGQVFVRGMPEDYDLWASRGNPAWSYRDVLPYFRRIENDLDFSDDYHGKDGPIPVRRYAPEEWLTSQSAYRDACLAAGFPDCPDLNAPSATGVGALPFNNIDGVRYSTAMTYLAPARRRKNLHIIDRTSVRRIRFDGVRAVGVEVERDGIVSSLEADEIILCAGAFGSPHLLLLSGVGPAAELGAIGMKTVLDLPGVGKNLHDHPAIGLRWRAAIREPLPAYPVHTHQVTLAYTSAAQYGRNDVRMRCQASHLAVDGAGINRVVTRDFSIRATLESAHSVGELRLASSEPGVDPVLNYCHLEASADRVRLRGAVRLALDLANSATLGRLVGERISPTSEALVSDDALDSWLLRAVGTADHISGTCKMGPGSDPAAVVGQDGKVHGLDNVRVVDASVVPDAVRANLAATIMMLAERIGDFIRRPELLVSPR